MDNLSQSFFYMVNGDQSGDQYVDGGQYSMEVKRRSIQ